MPTYTPSPMSPFLRSELAPFDREVLEALERGLSYDEIATELGVGKARVTNRVRSMRRKSGVSTAELPTMFVDDVPWTIHIVPRGQ